MKRHALVLLIFFTAVLSAVPFGFASQARPPATQYLNSRRGLCFTENKGQWDSRVLYKAEGAGGFTWFIERDGFTLVYSRQNDSQRMERIEQMFSDPVDLLSASSVKSAVNRRSHALKFKFLQSPSLPSTPWSQPSDISASASSITTSGRLSHNNNYFLGNDRSKWAPNCGNFKGLTCRDVWEGIDVNWYEKNGLVEFDFVVNPGADPNQIQMRVDGLTNQLELTADGGEIVLPTSLGEVKMAMPEAWMSDSDGDADAGRSGIAAKFVPIGDGRLGIALPEGYEAGKKLVVDPLVYSTYLGGRASEDACALVSDGNGGVIVTGKTNSNDLPTSEGAMDSTFSGGSWEGYVIHLGQDGNELLYCTYLGGGTWDVPSSIATDGAGGVIVAGFTQSDDFPTTEGAFDTSFNGGSNDAFVARLNKDGSALIYSTYLGGSHDDYANALMVDAGEGVVIAGRTGSDNFPTTDAALDELSNGNDDAFVARLNDQGSELIFSTYLGGSNYDRALALAAEAAGEIIVGGNTASEDFPVTQEAFDQSINGTGDAFIVRLSSDGSQLLYGTYIGGGDNEVADAVAIDGDGEIVVAGETGSWDFPTTHEAFDEQMNGSLDVFIARLSGDGRQLIFGTFLGGSNGDSHARCVALDAEGNAVIVGWCNSYNFPTTEGAFDRSLDGSDDGFVARLSSDGSDLLYCTYLGGNGHDQAAAFVMDEEGGIVIAGKTSSDDFPTTEGSLNESFNGGSNDAFITHINLDLPFFKWTEMPDTVVTKEHELVQFGIRGESSNPHANLTISYARGNLPMFARFEDHGDGSGTFIWVTGYDDAGKYTATFTLSDGENELPADVAIIVNDVNSPPQSFNLLLPEDGYRVAYDPDSLGTVDFVWEEARQAESDTDSVTYWMVFTEGMAQYTIGPLDSTHNEIAIQALADAIQIGREREITFGWDVWAMDSEVHVFATDGPRAFTIPALAVAERVSPIPDHYYLSANYPNPFNAQTRLNFGLPVAGQVSLEAWDLSGRRIETLASGFHRAGRYEAVWDAGTLPTGIYFVRMTAPGFEKTQRLVLIK